jgi:hypothetical protein
VHLEREEEPILILNYLLPPHPPNSQLSSDLYYKSVDWKAKGRAERRLKSFFM